MCGIVFRNGANLLEFVVLPVLVRHFLSISGQMSRRNRLSSVFIKCDWTFTEGIHHVQNESTESPKKMIRQLDVRWNIHSNSQLENRQESSVLELKFQFTITRRSLLFFPHSTHTRTHTDSNRLNNIAKLRTNDYFKLAILPGANREESIKTGDKYMYL